LTILLLEAFAIAAVLAIAFFAERYCPRWLCAADRAFERIAERPMLSIALVALVSLATATSLSLFVRQPQPNSHDEFSYLLAADTFALGRLTNPPHPLWVHFESFHILQQPTYASKFPPGQGLVLAAGQVIAGQPIAGVWLSVALGCGAICWMLMAWVPPRWALLGGLIAATHPLILEWSQSYWGGAVAMTGGALLLGAFRRFIDKPRALYSVILGLGMAVLANSRPYEGLVLSALVWATLLVWALGRAGPGWRMALRRLVLPVCLVLIPTAAAMGYYNFRVTGHPLQMPHAVHGKAYGIAPAFLWQKLQPEPPFRHTIFRVAAYNGVSDYLEQRSLGGLIYYGWEKIWRLATEFFPSWGLVIPLIMLPWVLKRDAWMKLAVWLIGFFLVGLLLEVWMNAHYAAPIAPLFFAVLSQVTRYLYQWHWRGRPIGRKIAQASIVLCLVGNLITAVRFAGWNSYYLEFGAHRARITSALKQLGGKHLIVVRYEPQHDQHAEWVYNEADIDNSAVVWAREMDRKQNRKLLDYFHDRSLWLLEPDLSLSPKPVPYKPAPR
jgi:hypothetical protein